jgi:hypothetical protein
MACRIENFGLEKFSSVINSGTTIRLCCYRIARERFRSFNPGSLDDQIFGLSRDRWSEIETLDHTILNKNIEIDDVKYIELGNGCVVPHYTIQRIFSRKKREIENFVSVGDRVRIISFERARSWHRFLSLRKGGIIFPKQAFGFGKSFYSSYRSTIFTVVEAGVKKAGLYSANIRSNSLDCDIEFDIPEILLKKIRSL